MAYEKIPKQKFGQGSSPIYSKSPGSTGHCSYLINWCVDALKIPVYIYMVAWPPKIDLIFEWYLQ